MGPILFLFVLIVALFACVQVGALLLELTGLDRKKARFQALSAFTTAGWTTREAEDIMRFPVRRRIVSALMVLGYAGFATAIGTVARSMLGGSVRTAVQSAIIGAAILLVILVARWLGVTSRLASLLRRFLMRRHTFDAPSAEEMLEVVKGYGVVRVRVGENCEVAEHTLAEMGLRSRNVQVLAIGRDNKWIVVPRGPDLLHVGDTLLCFGDEAAIEKLFGAHFTEAEPPSET